MVPSAPISVRVHDQPQLTTRSGSMAMNMTGEVQLPQVVMLCGAMLNEPAVLKSCIPGCESLDKDSDNEFQATATIKIGPVKARWKGKVDSPSSIPPQLPHLRRGGRWGRRICQRRAKVSCRQGWRYIVVLQRRSPDWWQAGPTRATPHQRRGEEDRRRFLQKFRHRRYAEGCVRTCTRGSEGALLLQSRDESRLLGWALRAPIS